MTHWCCVEHKRPRSPFSRLVTSTERRDGGMFSTATSHSLSPPLRSFLYSTRNHWMGKPRLPRGIHVTYADVSVAVETVGRSGASGAFFGVRERARQGVKPDEVHWELTGDYMVYCDITCTSTNRHVHQRTYRGFSLCVKSNREIEREEKTSLLELVTPIVQERKC